MKFPHFFIRRPIFAAVLSVLVVLVGLIAYPFLPVAQYPEIAPPTVVVNATYPGSTAETLMQTVAEPLEEQINGVENMLYMSSSSSGDGNLQITISFKPGTNVDQAQVLVQNRVATAEPHLPDQVRQIGVTVKKSSPDLLMAVVLTSPDHSLGQQYLSNYATSQVVDRLSRIDGVAGVRLYGARDYDMRLWIDPDRAGALNLTSDEIVAAVRAQNTQVSAGTLGQPPHPHGTGAYQLNIATQGRLASPEEFGQIVIKRLGEGRVIRLHDVARIEMGAQDYGINAYRSGNPIINMAIDQTPGSNALATAEAVRAQMKVIAKGFPPGMSYEVPYDPTEYIAASIEEVKHTLFEAIVLVALVVLVFLQSWRASIIPIIAIPVSLVGTFAVLAAFGYSLNNLSLFGLVLAIGIVVDDAIVVVENIERLMAQGLNARDAAHETMDEVSGALIAIALVLIGVFLPTTFIPGISGQFFKQFALTIISATAISAFVSLTLSPAMASLILRPHTHAEPAPGWRGLPARAARRFNTGFDALADRYGRYTARAVRMLAMVAVCYAGLIGLAGWRFAQTPTGFIPAQDQGYVIGIVQLPAGASLERTNAVLRQVEDVVLKDPAVEGTLSFAGMNAVTQTNSPSNAAMYTVLKPKGTRASSDEVIARLRKALAGVTGGNVLVIAPPPVRGIGNAGGFKMMVEDHNGGSLRDLEQVTQAMIKRAAADPAIAAPFTLFDTHTPRLYADIDRQKAEQYGVPVENVFATLGTYLGSTYINDFNFLGRTYRVTAQADFPYRDAQADVARLRTRSDAGRMVPLAAVMSLRGDSGPDRVVRYNMYPSAEVQGAAAPGHSSGQALAAMERIAGDTLPPGYAFEWTELAYQQQQAGNTGIIAFGLAVVVVFLLLAALYESLVLPLAVILIVPMCLLAAILGVNMMGLDNNILTQVGLVVLVGLAAKNAILIVEFAKHNEDNGMERREAARMASSLRLRPIVMTSIAFILGTLPLVVGNGPGSEMRQALGVAVFFGMIGVTLFGLLFTPSFYVMSRNLGDRIAARVARWRQRKATPAAHIPHAEETAR
ncbi:MAG TPA: multidrug efflux RND transporter permease subunit [Novosphingobium sp.]|nr:multidrug efflux RND transporter permease subunit [Novosphingobium sp.]